MNEQQKRIAEKIPDKTYYESEEFQTLLGLVVERLNTTHDTEKLKLFGNALANCGSSEFRTDSREDFIRILRDLSTVDLSELQLFAPRIPKGYSDSLDIRQQFNFRGARKDLHGEALSRTTRLIGLGLVNESLKMKEFTGSLNVTSANEARSMLSDYLKQAPEREYALSEFGWRFLQFLAEGADQAKPGEPTS